ncbi:MAG: DnaA/Hda family protein [Alistipes senegalensis]|nr:DnaA/Hda family protein [Alistipes senegalensis]
MIEVFDMIAKNAREANPVKSGDYIKDGLLYCGKCYTPMQSRVELPEFLKGKVTDVVYGLCACRKAEFEREDELKKRQEAEHKRNMCFSDYEMTEWRFENDDGKGDNHAMQIARNYVKNFEMLRADGVGLFIHGDVGAGKSFMAGCIANALIDVGVTAYMTDFTAISNEIFKTKDKNAYCQQLNDNALLVIDDLGRERDSGFVTENVASVLDARCRCERPLILTSNFSPDDLKKESSTELKRIYSRLFKLCIPVKFEGIDRRQVQMIQNMAKYHNILGL